MLLEVVLYIIWNVAATSAALIQIVYTTTAADKLLSHISEIFLGVLPKQVL